MLRSKPVIEILVPTLSREPKFHATMPIGSHPGSDMSISSCMYPTSTDVEGKYLCSTFRVLALLLFYEAGAYNLNVSDVT